MLIIPQDTKIYESTSDQIDDAGVKLELEAIPNHEPAVSPGIIADTSFSPLPLPTQAASNAKPWPVEEPPVTGVKQGQEGADDDSNTSISSSPKSSSSITVQPPAVEVPAVPERLHTASERPLILYAYSETKPARVNLEFFIAHGLHANADFVFILNGPTNAPDIIPKEANIRYVQRLNDCYDLGAYAEVLIRDDLYKGYKHFIMLNASIRGPFLPYWAEGCWSDMYLKRVTEKVKVLTTLAATHSALDRSILTCPKSSSA